MRSAPPIRVTGPPTSAPGRAPSATAHPSQRDPSQQDPSQQDPSQQDAGPGVLHAHAGCTGRSVGPPPVRTAGSLHVRLRSSARRPRRLRPVAGHPPASDSEPSESARFQAAPAACPRILCLPSANALPARVRAASPARPVGHPPASPPRGPQPPPFLARAPLHARAARGAAAHRSRAWFARPPVRTACSLHVRLRSSARPALPARRLAGAFGGAELCRRSTARAGPRRSGDWQRRWGQARGLSARALRAEREWRCGMRWRMRSRADITPRLHRLGSGSGARRCAREHAQAPASSVSFS